MERAAVAQGFLSGNADAPSSPEFVSELASAVERGRKAWPDVCLSEVRLGEELAARVRKSADPLSALRSLHVEDFYLVIACASGEPAALAHFERAYVPRIRFALARLRLSVAEVEEAVQVLREELLVSGSAKPPGILNYAGRANLHGWLRVVAGRIGQRVARQPAGQVALEESAIGERRDDPELQCLKRTCGEAFQQAFQEALGALSAEDRLLLKRRFAHDLSCEELGVLYGVNRSTVFRRVTDARARLVDATRASIVRRLNLGRGDFSSVLRLIQSEIDITLSEVAQRQSTGPPVSGTDR